MMSVVDPASKQIGRIAAAARRLCLIAATGLMLPTAVHANDRMNVSRDIRFEPGQVVRGPIVVTASGVTIDGNGATVRAPGVAGDRDSFNGEGITVRPLTM